MTAHRIPRIAIVGGGFSGTMTAVNLARLSPFPLRITLINHGYSQGRGIAYSTRRPEHLLNVAARNMSALPEHPNHFVDWLRTRTEFVDVAEAELRELFMPRRLYGDYLRSLALHYTRPVDARSRVTIDLIDDEVTELKPVGKGIQLMLSSGGLVEADKVLLATGNEPPAVLPGEEAVAQHPAWCANPWVDWEKKLPPDGDTIVLLGTGLTTVDAVLTLLALDWRGTIYAVSRNGLIPQSHFKGIEDPHFPPADLDLASLGLEALVRLVEEHCERLRREGANPAMVVDKFRPHTQRVWQGFSDADRREFVSRYSARWNVIRHRIAPSIHGQVTAAIEQGRLKIIQACIAAVKPLGSRIAIELRARDGTFSFLEAGLAINCTGPHTRFSATRSKLLQNLLGSGLVQPDAMDMGIRIEPDFAVVERSGRRSPFLFAIGPLLRGTLWESIAVPELRNQALRVAQTLLGEKAVSKLPDGRWPGAEEAPVLEYWI
jgi:uncharacterized NAD(P)/FAD-binding protein YdhS